MKTITVKIDDAGFDLFIELIKKHNFHVEVQIPESNKKSVLDKKNASIRISNEAPSINDFAGLWANNPKSLDQIREKAWKRI